MTLQIFSIDVSSVIEIPHVGGAKVRFINSVQDCDLVLVDKSEPYSH